MTELIVALVLMSIFGLMTYWMFKYLLPKDPPDNKI